MPVRREVKESPLYQGVDEEIAYTLTTTPWGSSPSSVAVKIYDVTNNAYTDSSTDLLSGSASATGDVITLPIISGLTAEHKYRVEVKFTCSGNVFEAYAVINGEQ